MLPGFQVTIVNFAPVRERSLLNPDGGARTGVWRHDAGFTELDWTPGRQKMEIDEQNNI